VSTTYQLQYTPTTLVAIIVLHLLGNARIKYS